MKTNQNILRRLLVVIVTALLISCNSGGGSAVTPNGGNVAPTIENTMIKVDQEQFAAPVLITGEEKIDSANKNNMSMNAVTAKACLAISNLQMSIGQWWSSGTISIKNNCTTTQEIGGLQVIISAAVALDASQIQLNSISGLYFPPPIYWAASSMSASNYQNGTGRAAILMVINTTGLLQTGQVMSVSFGYNTGSVTPNNMTASLSDTVTPVNPGAINLRLDTTNLATVCSGSNTCSIPIVLNGQNGQFNQTLDTVTNSKVNKIINYNVSNLLPGTYIISAAASSLPENVQFKGPSSLNLPAGGTINESASFVLLPPTKGNISFVIAKPVNLAESSINVMLLNAQAQQTGILNALYNQTALFNNIVAGSYSIISYGLADAVNGIFYKPLSQSINVIAGQNNNIGTLSLTQHATTELSSVVIHIESLAVGEKANIVLTDNYNGKLYQFKPISLANGNTNIKLLTGDNVTFNITPSVSGKYLAITPATYKITSGMTIDVKFVQGGSNTGFNFGPYKDVGINANWNTLVMSTVVGSSNNSIIPLVQAIQTKALYGQINSVTWAFATGECGQENWAGMDAVQFASANKAMFESARQNFIVSTGGVAGVFTCSSDAGMDKFMQRYNSPYLIGLDFDIEGGQTTQQLTSLIRELKYIQAKYPNLRISFTLATLGGSDGSSLNSLGQTTINLAKQSGLNFYVNLMVMDYGAASSIICVLNSSNLCDMGKTAIKAAQNFSNAYNIPYNKIELTPMIGDNDVRDEIFSFTDVTYMISQVKILGISGIHFWSFDRDIACATMQPWASPTCNTASTAANAGHMAFTNAFKQAMNNNGL